MNTDLMGEALTAIRALSVELYGVWGEEYGVGWTVWDMRRPSLDGTRMPNALGVAQGLGVLARGERITSAVWATVLARAGLQPAEPWLAQRDTDDDVDEPVLLLADGPMIGYHREGMPARPVKRQVVEWCPWRHSYVVVGEQLVYELI